MAKRKLVFIIPLILVLVVLSAFTACAKPAPPPPPTPAPTPTPTPAKVLKVGCSIPTSGPAAAWGLPTYRGNAIIIDMINDRGGVNIGGETYIIEYIVEDNEFSPAGAVAATEKLVTVDKVVFVTGGISGHTALATASVTEKYGMIYSHTAFSIPLMCAKYPHAVRWSACNAEVVVPIYTYAREAWPDAKRIALVALHQPSSISTEVYVRKFAPHVGMELVHSELYEPGIKDFRPLLLKVLVAKPDIIETCAAPPPEAALMVKQARELGYKGGFVSICPFPERELLEIAGAEASEGYAAYGYPIEGPMATEGYKELYRRYVEKYGEWDNIASMANFTEAVLEAMEIAGTTDADEVMKVLESGRKFESLLVGEMFFGRGELYQLPHQGIYKQYVQQMQNGKGVFVYSMTADEQLAIFDELGWTWEDTHAALVK